MNDFAQLSTVDALILWRFVSFRLTFDGIIEVKFQLNETNILIVFILFTN